MEKYPLTTIEKANEIGEGIPKGQITTEYFYVKGRIVGELHATYGNCYITDENGNTIYVYGLYDGEGNRYNAMENKPVEGDVVILYAQIMHYVNPNTGEEKIELKDAVLVEITE